jgi:predicted ABC-type ATPase
VGGPNGSGKTTFFTKMFARNPSIRFINADIVARELNYDAPEKAAMDAGREILKRLRQLERERTDFAFEATLSGVWHAKYLHGLRDVGFRIVIYFLWLRSEDLAVRRVNDRYEMGGHTVPEHDIRRRYLRSAYNMSSLYRHIADEWFLYDNSGQVSQLIASEEGGIFKIKKKRIFDEILKEVKAYEQSIKKEKTI